MADINVETRTRRWKRQPYILLVVELSDNAGDPVNALVFERGTFDGREGDAFISVASLSDMETLGTEPSETEPRFLASEVELRFRSEREMALTKAALTASIEDLTMELDISVAMADVEDVIY